MITSDKFLDTKTVCNTLIKETPFTFSIPYAVSYNFQYDTSLCKLRKAFAVRRPNFQAKIIFGFNEQFDLSKYIKKNKKNKKQK